MLPTASFSKGNSWVPTGASLMAANWSAVRVTAAASGVGAEEVWPAGTGAGAGDLGTDGSPKPVRSRSPAVAATASSPANLAGDRPVGV